MIARMTPTAYFVGVLCLLVDVPRTLAAGAPPVTLGDEKTAVVMDNGILTLTVSKHNGDIISIRRKHLGRDVELTDGRQGMYLDANGGPDEPPANVDTKQFGEVMYDAIRLEVEP